MSAIFGSNFLIIPFAIDAPDPRHGMSEGCYPLRTNIPDQGKQMVILIGKMALCIITCFRYGQPVCTLSQQIHLQDLIGSFPGKRIEFDEVMIFTRMWQLNIE